MGEGKGQGNPSRRRLFWSARAPRGALADPHVSEREPARPWGGPWSNPWYRLYVNAVRGRVREGRVELEAALPEGAEVVVLAAGRDGPFDLDDAQLAEIEARMAEADGGAAEPAAAVIEKLRLG